jgi:single-stranded DNA-binding protein
MVNVNFVGRLGADAILKQDKSQRNFVTFTVAVDEYRDGKNETVWMRVSDGSERAIKMQPHLKKGSLISVHGIESVRLFTRANGTVDISRDVRADRLDFVKVSASAATTSPTTSEQTSRASTPTQSEPNMQDISCGTFGVTPHITQSQMVTATVTSSPSVEDDLPF